MHEWIEGYAPYKTIKNHSLEEIIRLVGESHIYIPDWDIVCFCKQKERRKLLFFRILGCQNEFLRGIHTISYKQQIYTIPSFSILKKNFFETFDPTSLERCCFIIVPQYRKLIRLKNARILIQCPRLTLSIMELDYSPSKKIFYKVKQIRHTQKKEYIRQLDKQFEQIVYTIQRFYTVEKMSLEAACSLAPTLLTNFCRHLALVESSLPKKEEEVVKKIEKKRVEQKEQLDDFLDAIEECMKDDLF